jgi:hypothetical protein
MNSSTGQNYYSYVLMDPRSHETSKFLDAAKNVRSVSGANQGREEKVYQIACAKSIKQVDTTISRAVIVAHCDEDLSWMQALDPTLNRFVYSKGKEIVGEQLPNVGREFHTYFTHIVRHYSNLADVNFFLQGWPLDRSAHVVSGVNYLRHFDFIEFGTNILETGPVDDRLFNFLALLFGPSADCACSRKPWEFRANTQFGASRRRIQQRSLAFYENCCKICEVGVPSYQIGAESVPYFFEQVWKYIFG